ncbi:MAG: phage terminase large subunit [Clostridia bacterium]|nr:phage terminase large subunit [Clostridia bacterium]
MNDKQACAADPMAFGRRYLGHYFTLSSPAFHRQLGRLWQKRVMKGMTPGEDTLPTMLAASGCRLALAAPRGHAKSTVMSLQNVLHAALYGYKKYILLVSDTESQATSFLDCIKAELEENEDLLADFGPQKGKVWKSGVILLQNGCRIDAVGSGQKLRGRRHGARRPDLILLDDIENDQEVLSADGRRKLERWYFGAVSKAGDRYTDIICVGTVLHHDSLLVRLLENPAYRTVRWQAVERFSDSPLWEEWRKRYTDRGDDDRDKNALRFFRANRKEMLAGTKVLWPQKLSYYDLMCMMVSEGEGAFWQEMQNQPQDPAACLFPREWLRFYDREGIDFRAGFRFFGYCDPSLGKTAGSDFSAILTLAQHRESGLLYVLDADLERRHPDRIIQDVLEKARWLRREYGAQYTAFGAETNQFQWFLKERLAAESAAAGVYLPLVEVRAASDKVLRIQSLQPDIRNGYLLFCRDQTELLRQLEQFPLGRHDDGPDALEGAVRLCKQGGRLTTLGLRV